MATSSRRDAITLADVPIVRKVESFEALFRREYRGIFRLAIALSGSRTVAEDLTQDASSPPSVGGVGWADLTTLRLG